MYGLLSYVYLGISLSAPIGPINAAQMETGLRKGFSYAWLFGLGAILADIVYMILVYFGLATYMNIPIIQTFLWLFGAFVLIYSGIESLVSSVTANEKSPQRNAPMIFLHAKFSLIAVPSFAGFSCGIIRLPYYPASSGAF